MATSLPQQPDRYLRAPCLFTHDQRLWLAVIGWFTDQGEACVTVALDAQGTPGEERVGPLLPAVTALRLNEDGEIEASADAGPERRAAREGFVVELREDGGVSEVWLRRPKAEDVLVFRSAGSVAAPALAVAPDGVWVAFHHDQREDDGRIDVAKWIGLFHVDSNGQVREPALPMLDRDRDREGVEQSFEFPALEVAPDGALAIVGRGSHNFWRQDLNAQGFSSRVPLSDGEWGSRGRRPATCLFDGALFVARRERHGIEIDRLVAPSGGAPTLRSVRPSRVTGGHSRPVRQDDPAARHGRVTLFGDIQQHSAHSDGVGSAEEVYRRARHRYGDDFVALTDHESFLGKRTGPGEWAYLQAVAEAYDAPGEFVSLIAYEWTGKMYPGPGHKCVYYPRTGLPIVSRDDVPEGAALVKRVRALGGFASPHHIGWTGADEPGHDDLGQPLWEICSCHGCYEHPDHPLGQRGALRDQMVDTMLRRGHRFGFTASSDSHGLLWHHGEARKRDPYRTGLTAVQATSCTREAIMRALVERRAYATSGAKILLDLSAEGAPMGSELPARQVDVEVNVVGESALRSLQLVGPEGVVAEGHVVGLRGSLRARATAPFAYARVTQEDGEMAWSSPIFLG